MIQARHTFVDSTRALPNKCRCCLRADLLCSNVTLDVADWVEGGAGVALQEADVEDAERVLGVFAYLHMPSCLRGLC